MQAMGDTTGGRTLRRRKKGENGGKMSTCGRREGKGGITADREPRERTGGICDEGKGARVVAARKAHKQ